MVVLLYLFLGFLVFIFLLPLRLTISFAQDWQISDDTGKSAESLSSLLIVVTILDKITIYRLSKNFQEDYHRKIITLLEQEFIKKIDEEEKAAFSLLKEEWDKIKNKVGLYLKKLHIYNPDKIIKDLNLKCIYFNWITEIGFYDPALTGSAVGLLWIIKGGIMNFVTAKTIFKTDPIIRVIPSFSEEIFSINFKGIFASNLGYIMFVAIKIISRKIKGGISSWMEARLTNLSIRQ